MYQLSSCLFDFKRCKKRNGYCHRLWAKFQFSTRLCFTACQCHLKRCNPSLLLRRSESCKGTLIRATSLVEIENWIQNPCQLSKVTCCGGVTKPEAGIPKAGQCIVYCHSRNSCHNINAKFCSILPFPWIISILWAGKTCCMGNWWSSI